MSCTSLSVGACGVNVTMEFSDDEDFQMELTQKSTREYSVTPCAEYGLHVVENVVSLEGQSVPKFEVGMEDLVGNSQSSGVDVEFEDISSDEDLGKM